MELLVKCRYSCDNLSSNNLRNKDAKDGKSLKSPHIRDSRWSTLAHLSGGSKTKPIHAGIYKANEMTTRKKLMEMSHRDLENINSLYTKFLEALIA